MIRLTAKDLDILLDKWQATQRGEEGHWKTLMEAIPDLMVQAREAIAYALPPQCNCGLVKHCRIHGTEQRPMCGNCARVTEKGQYGRVKCPLHSSRWQIDYPMNTACYKAGDQNA